MLVRLLATSISAMLLVMACGGSEPTRSESPSGFIERRERSSRGTGPEPPAQGRVSSHGDGASCDAARDTYSHGVDAELGEPSEAQDEEIKRTLNHGTYLNACGVSPSAAVTICAAIVQGVARGVTVSVDPAPQEQADCVANAIFKMSFPSHPRMSVARTEFAPSQ